jgi:hypothetical protein
MRVALKDITVAIIKYKRLDFIAVNGFVYYEISKDIYGLPKASVLVNNDLIIPLQNHGYVQSPNTTDFFTHQTRLISFCLVVDDFCVQIIVEEHTKHHIKVFQKKNTIAIVWPGDLYDGLYLYWY